MPAKKLIRKKTRKPSMMESPDTLKRLGTKKLSVMSDMTSDRKSSIGGGSKKSSLSRSPTIAR